MPTKIEHDFCIDAVLRQREQEVVDRIFGTRKHRVALKLVDAIKRLLEAEHTED